MAKLSRKQYAVGSRVGDWKLLEYRPSKCEQRPDGQWRAVSPCMWKCACSCGCIRWVRADNLASGQSQHCGHRNPGNKRWKALDVRAVNSVFALGGQA